MTVERAPGAGGPSARVRAYVLDVEGTTSPISLVTERMFPYARRHLRAYLSTHGSDGAVREELALLARERAGESDETAPEFSAESASERADEAADYLLWLMDRDRKSTALKSLQGKIWRTGFEAGELQGEVFADVPEALRRLHSEAQVLIYSSGSTEAQKLLFRHSSCGDLTPWIDGYFDTRTGPKREARSYRALAGAAHLRPAELLFVSDMVAELDAAREAGCETRLALREGNGPVAEGHGHRAIRSFAEIGEG